MSAAEVLAEHEYSTHEYFGGSCACGLDKIDWSDYIVHLLSSLKGDRCAVVDLEDVDELRSGWCLDVKANGKIHDHAPLDVYTAEDARGFAAALLAAADAAEGKS